MATLTLTADGAWIARLAQNLKVLAGVLGPDNKNISIVIDDTAFTVTGGGQTLKA